MKGRLEGQGSEDAPDALASRDANIYIGARVCIRQMPSHPVCPA